MQLDPEAVAAFLVIAIVIAIATAILIGLLRSNEGKEAAQFKISALDLQPANGRLRACTVEQYRAEDFAACRELYLLNEPNRFPAGILPDYERKLEDSGANFITLKIDGVIVGCGGISYYHEHNGVVLMYGLIHPDHHGTGLGTTLLLARLALFRPAEPMLVAGMQAVPTSRGFYERFGFTPFSESVMNGVPLVNLVALITDIQRAQCVELLEAAGVVLPTGDRSDEHSDVPSSETCR